MLLRISWTMQVRTQALEKTASIASGEPDQAVDAGDQDVLDAAVVQVVEDGQQNLAPSVSCHQIPSTLALALTADADRQGAGAGSDRAVVADLDHQAVETGDRRDAPSGRVRHATTSSSTASVTRLMVSRLTSTP